MFKRCINILKRVFAVSPYNSCYSHMEKAGRADFGFCEGRELDGTLDVACRSCIYKYPRSIQG